MTIAQLGIAYLVVGAALAIGFGVARRIAVADGLLVVVVWPLWTPLLLAKPVERAAAGDLEVQTREVGEQLREVSDRLAELDRRSVGELETVRARYEAERAELAQLRAQLAASVERARIPSPEPECLRAPDGEYQQAPRR